MLFKKHVTLLLCLTATTLFAQGRTPLNGKVIADAEDLSGIYVINKTSDATVKTTRGGYFTIDAQLNDTLVFSAEKLGTKPVLVTEESFSPDLFFVALDGSSYLIPELLIIDYSYINEESLGLVPAGQKQYTPAERRVATASSWRMNPMGLDPIINLFSGRTAMLRNAAEIAKKEDLMQKIGYLYTEEDIVSKLKVPVDYVKGFVYYAVENKHFVKAMDDKNQEMAKFLLSALAQKYIKLLTEDE
ncbi:MAG: hypothetical protein V4581_02960 [Bacteroidota bacterium]